MRAALSGRSLGKRTAGKDPRHLRRWRGMELCRTAPPRRRQGGGPAKARRAPGRLCCGLAAKRARRADRFLCDQLSRCDLRAVQHRLSRQSAGACRRQFGCQGDDRASRSGRAARRDRSRGAGAARARHERRGTRYQSAGGALRRDRRRHTRPAGTPDRAVGHSVDHLHIGHDRPVEGRAVLLSPHVFQRRARILADGGGGRSLYVRRADLPYRRHGPAVRDARARRVGRADRILLDRAFLGHRTANQIHRGVPARGDGDLPDEARARPGRP